LDVQLTLQPVVVAAVENVVEKMEPMVVLAVAVELIVVLVEPEILLQQLPLKEKMVVIKITLPQHMVEAVVEVILRLVLMVHRLQEGLVEQEQIFVLLIQEF
tara:strand:- start:1029 stop:1334 length:306 start_codon:yes stop_codon:yes gene_type:complete